MRGLPDKAYDLAICDPDFGLAQQKMFRPEVLSDDIAPLKLDF